MNNDSLKNKLSSSFRDPSGFVFSQGGAIYRHISSCYFASYELCNSSGLYKELFDRKLLVPHEEIDENNEGDFKTIRPIKIPLISYPYEWSFSQLKDAALTTLKIQEIALNRGLSLKDASAYNIQFLDGKPIFIDTLSFEAYEEGEPWVAFQQFCKHFIAPLALMSMTDIRLNQLLRTNIDGIPLDLTSKLLPRRSWLKLSLLLNIHLHAKQQSKHSVSSEESPSRKSPKGKLKKSGLIALIKHLEACVNGMQLKIQGTEWDDYYEANNNYTTDSMANKEKLVGSLLEQASKEQVWDLGANDGRFSRLATTYSDNVIAWDIDPACVERNYRNVRRLDEKGILPLLMDLTNPSPAIGWNNAERMSFVERGDNVTLMALGLIHHIVISNNVPLLNLAEFFASMASYVILEFVPKSDSQVEKLLATRQDIFPDYTEEGFEQAMSSHFTTESKTKIDGSERTLYLLKNIAVSETN